MESSTSATSVNDMLPPSGIMTKIGFLIGFRGSEDLLMLSCLMVFLWFLIAIVLRTQQANLSIRGFRYSDVLPEETITVFVGIAMSAILWPTGLVKEAIGGDNIGKMPSFALLFVILPFIYFRMGFLLPHKLFLRNLGTILLLGLVGTMILTTVIGLSLYGCRGLFSFELSFPAAMTYSSAMSMLNPGIVFGIMKRMNVNAQLQVLLLGEFTVGRALVLIQYFLFHSWAEHVYSPVGAPGEISASALGTAFGTTLVRLVIEIAIGVVVSCIACVLSLKPAKDPILELFLVICIMCFLFFFCRELYLVSSMSQVVCGFLMAAYYVPNLGHKSTGRTLESFLQFATVALITLLHVLFGALLVAAPWSIDWTFLVLTFLLIYGYRAVVTIGLALLRGIIMKKKKYIFSWRGLFCLWICGARGEGLFILTLIALPEPYLPRKHMLSNALILLLFNMFVQVPLARVALRYLESAKPTTEATSNEQGKSFILERMLGTCAVDSFTKTHQMDNFESAVEDSHVQESVLHDAISMARYQYSRAKNHLSSLDVPELNSFQQYLDMVEQSDAVINDYFELLTSKFTKVYDDQQRPTILQLMKAPSAVLSMLEIQNRIPLHEPEEGTFELNEPSPERHDTALFSKDWMPFLELLLRYGIVELDNTDNVRCSAAFSKSRIPLHALHFQLGMSRLSVWLHFAETARTKEQKSTLLYLFKESINWEQSHLQRILSREPAQFAALVLGEGASVAAKGIHRVVQPKRRFKPKNIISQAALHADAIMHKLFVRSLNSNERTLLSALGSLQDLHLTQLRLRHDKVMCTRNTESVDHLLRLQADLDSVTLRIARLNHLIEKLRSCFDVNEQRCSLELKHKEDKLLGKLLNMQYYSNLSGKGSPLVEVKCNVEPRTSPAQQTE